MSAEDTMRHIWMDEKASSALPHVLRTYRRTGLYCFQQLQLEQHHRIHVDMYARFQHLTLCSTFLLYTRCQKDGTAHACESWIAQDSNASMPWQMTSVLRQYVAVRRTIQDCSDNSTRQCSRSKGYFELANISKSCVVSPIPAG